MPTPQSENYPSPIDDSTAEDYSSEVLTELPEPAPAPTIEAPKIGKLRRIGRAILGRSAAIASVEDEPLETTETATETARPQDTWSDDEWGGWDDAPAATQEMAEQRYAKELPKFSDQVADASRTNTFSFRRYTRSYGAYGDIFNQEQPEVETMTEHDGLVDLQSFLEMAHARGVGMGVAVAPQVDPVFLHERR